MILEQAAEQGKHRYSKQGQVLQWVVSEMLQLPYILIPWIYPRLQTQNFRLWEGGGFQHLKVSGFF